MGNFYKKIFFFTIFFSFAFELFAPSCNTVFILKMPPAEPFKKLIHAIGRVETKYDTLAYNPEEEAVGYFQIRPIRVEDYNKRTGSNYKLTDMYNYKISEKVFLYYASEIGPYDFERIAKRWNGSGSMTIQYWKQVKKYL
jgi:hypothetical protein